MVVDEVGGGLAPTPTPLSSPKPPGQVELSDSPSPTNSYHAPPLFPSQFLVTADDQGLVKLFNYPCVVDDAPHRAYRGHSSHVMGVKFNCNDTMVGYGFFGFSVEGAVASLGSSPRIRLPAGRMHAELVTALARPAQLPSTPF